MSELAPKDGAFYNSLTEKKEEDVLRKLWLSLLAAIMALSLVAIACGDDDDDDDDDNGGGTATATATAPVDDDADDGDDDDDDDDSAGVVTGGSLTDVTSFEYELVFEGDLADLASAFAPTGDAADIPEGELRMSGAFKAPDRARFEINIGDEALLGVVVIGAEQWLNIGGQWIGPTPADTPADENVLAFDFAEDFDTEGLKCEGDSEDVNGVEAVRCSLSREDLDELADVLAAFGEDVDSSEIPEDFEFEVWVAKDGGYPVRVSFGGTDPTTGANLGFTMNISNINGDVEIEPPTT